MSNQGSHAIVDVDLTLGDESAVVFKAIFITFPAIVKGCSKAANLL